MWLLSELCVCIAHDCCLIAAIVGSQIRFFQTYLFYLLYLSVVIDDLED